MGDVKAVFLSILPLLAFFLTFLLVLMALFRKDGITKLGAMVQIFLSAPATLKTWGLVAAGPVLSLLLNSIIGKISDNASWPATDSVSAARLAILGYFGYGLLVLMSIVLGALGAVTFKGQLPGGASFQLNPDGSANASGPAAPLPPTPTPDSTR